MEVGKLQQLRVFTLLPLCGFLGSYKSLAIFTVSLNFVINNNEAIIFQITNEF